jgi:hypothetical protein
MKVVRKFVLGCLLAVALACAAVAAAPQDQPSNATGRLWIAGQTPGYSPYGPASAELAHQYVAAEKPEAKKEFHKRLSDQLSQEFDVHIKNQQKELEDLEKQIANLRNVLKKRIDAKTTIVERRVEQLIQDAEGLGWNAPSSTGRGYGRPVPYSSLPGQPENKPLLK